MSRRNQMNVMQTVRLAILLCLLSPITYAETLDVQALLAEMAVIKNNESLLANALEEGYERAVLCVHCHGEDGNSKRDRIPNLASQNSEYLFTQFEHFANGVRKDYVMSKLAGGLSAQDRVAVALYFSSQEVKPRANGVATSAEGARIYMSTCVACHGQEGHGNANYPRIAGQPYEFLEMTLLRFLNADEVRKNSPMTPVVQHLSEKQLKEVAAYVSNMP